MFSGNIISSGAVKRESNSLGAHYDMRKWKSRKAQIILLHELNEKG